MIPEYIAPFFVSHTHTLEKATIEIADRFVYLSTFHKYYLTVNQSSVSLKKGKKVIWISQTKKRGPNERFILKPNAEGYCVFAQTSLSYFQYCNNKKKFDFSKSEKKLDSIVPWIKVVSVGLVGGFWYWIMVFYLDVV